MIKVTPAHPRKSSDGSEGEFKVKFLVTNKAREFRQTWQTSLCWEMESLSAAE